MKLSAAVITGGLIATVASAFQTSLPGSQHQHQQKQKQKQSFEHVAARLPPLASTMVSTIDISETAQRDVYSMQEWANNCGVQTADGFELTADRGQQQGQDYHVTTKTDLPAGSPVVFVPNGMLLSSFGAAQEFGPTLQDAERKLAEAGLDSQIPLFRLFVKILAEYEKGEQSPYFPWLNSLPRVFYNGASMTYACFECLPPYVGYLSMKERTNSVNFQKAVQALPFNPPVISEETRSNTELLKWAYSIANTRSIDVNGEKVIAPLADMFNHGTETEVEVQLDDDFNCVAYATRDVRAGSPLRVSLGDPTDPSPLFAKYGFVDESSPASFCKLMDKRKEMEALGYDFSNLLFYKDTGDISPEVWDVVLYSILAQDPSLQQGFYEACRSGDADTKTSYHQQYFQYSLEALKAHVNGFLKEVDELTAKARAKDPRTHPRVPVILKHNEFVKSTFLKVKANLDAMG